MSLPRIHAASLRAVRLDGETLTLGFAPSRPVRHRAGQHGIWRIPGAGVVPFTFMSAPGAPLLEFSTVYRSDSPRKVALRGLAAGAHVKVLGALGGFPADVNEASSQVMVAQGVGITPFVSMLRDLDAHRDVMARPRTSLVQVGPAHHRAEVDSLADEVSWHAHRDGFEGRLDSLVAERAGDRTWLVAGAPAFARAVSARLRSAGVPEGRVHTDAFWGARTATRASAVAS